MKNWNQPWATLECCLSCQISLPFECFHTCKLSCMLVIGLPKTLIIMCLKLGQCDVCIDCSKYNFVLVIYIF